MQKKYTSVFENGLIWFGAAVSIAEILTGTYIAPLGFIKGTAAIIIGHIIGCAMLFLAGVISGKMRKSAMESAKISFGSKGALLFSMLNIIQLIGWTAIMIYDGALAVNGISGIDGRIWCVVIGLLIILWIMIGIKNLKKINVAAMTGLFILTLLLCFMIFKNGSTAGILTDSITFGAAVELSVAMPLSWLPLIGDYTMQAEKPVRSTAVSALTYGVVSCWMYMIGMGAAIFTQEADIARVIMKAGAGMAGLLIIIFSTVTTTFLDAYSAGVSSESISKRINGKWFAVAVTAVGTVCAVFLPLNDITDFLYFIGSVFAPMVAVQIADFFILKHCETPMRFNIANIIIWFVGFIIYRLLMTVDTVIGNTLPDMMITVIICIAVDKIKEKI